jgi:LEA14-like dessication related protein
MAIPDFRRACCAAALFCLLAGCASTANLQPPDLSVVSVKMQSADLFSQKLLVRMRVMNPNDRELPVKAITYRMEVDELEFANGASSAPFVVPALGEAEFDVQVNANLATAAMKFLGRGSGPQKVNYRLVGKVSLSSGLVRSIPFDERGSFDLK